KRLATVRRAPEADIHDPNLVLVLRMRVNPRVVPGALAEIAIFAGLGPGLAGVVGAEDAAVVGFDQRPDALGIDGRNRDANDADRLFRQPFVSSDLRPVIAAVGAFPQPGAGATALEAVWCALDA